jgi:hypothetical protein
VLTYPSTTPGVPPTVLPIGVTGPSEQEKKYPQYNVPGNPIGPHGTVPGGIDETKPIPSPANTLPGRNFQTTIPALNKQPPMSDWNTYGQMQPDWLKTSAELADAGITAERAETNLTAIARAYQMVESGTWAMQKAEFAGYLKALNLSFSGNANDLAQLQIALHNNYKQTLSTLKAANSKFTGNEFKINSDAGESAGNQPAANLVLLSQDIAQVRQIQGLASDWNTAQGMIGSDGRQWKNPDAFRTAWREVNPLQPMIDQARTQFPLRGTSGFVPPGLPEGTTPTGRMYNGKPVYKLPNGQTGTF